LTDATWKKALFDPINAKQYDMTRGGLTPSGEGEMWCFIEKVARVSDIVK
jgi:phage pi2 protein 07